MTIREEVERGRVHDRVLAPYVDELAWNEHPTFKGVHLKHLLRGTNTDGGFSSHRVRVEAGCEFGMHVHDAQWELHQVIEGRGQLVRGERQIPYAPGVTATMPKGVAHAVRAQEELYLLVTFVPPLL